MVVELTTHRVSCGVRVCAPTVQCTRELCILLTSYTVFYSVLTLLHYLTLCYTILHDIILFYMMIHYLTLSYTIILSYTVTHCAFLIVGKKLFFG